MKIFIFNLIFLCGLHAITIPMDKGDFAETTISTSNRQERNALSDKNKLWPNGIIPYTISGDYNSDQIEMIKNGMAEFQQKSCIRFEPKTSSHSDYLDIIKGTGCSAYAGRQGGRQTLSLANDCFFNGVILHELMHAIGFCHEQTRPDQDKHVKIIWENINDADKLWFRPLPQHQVQNLGEKYDVNSVMHYAGNAFAKNGYGDTIVPINSEDSLYQRNEFSESDIRQINKLYECNISTRTSCTDDNIYCKQWAQLGECTSTNRAYMTISCRKACGLCTDISTRISCKDDDNYCSQWAQLGECTANNRAYMEGKCRKSCGRCT